MLQRGPGDGGTLQLTVEALVPPELTLDRFGRLGPRGTAVIGGTAGCTGTFAFFSGSVR